MLLCMDMQTLTRGAHYRAAAAAPLYTTRATLSAASVVVVPPKIGPALWVISWPSVLQALGTHIFIH